MHAGRGTGSQREHAVCPTSPAKLPWSHGEQASCPWESLYVPSGQGTQPSGPAAKPGSHRHAAADDMPTDSEKELSGQGVQAVAPAAVWKVAFGHGSHGSGPAADLYFPAAQSAHLQRYAGISLYTPTICRQFICE